MKIYDVTVPISRDMIVYPGDPPVKIDRRTTIGKNDAKCNLSRYSFGSHSGTHVDPPFHFIENGITVDQLPMELLLGLARVVEISAACLDEAALEEIDLTNDVRVLFKTRNSYLWSQKKFVEDYVYITPGAARTLVSNGIKVVGVDYLSVEKYGAPHPETHLTLLEAGTVIIEGLDLREVEPGDYEMLCLPLKVKDGDGAPARVLLRQS
ncbi:MAG TPA: cyclase family protein [Blastocatellia bacterium]|jgi:arylformamidase|nr:cyclase family protein [Blastocatellia bacterium]